MVESGTYGSESEPSDGESLRRGFLLGAWRVHPEDGQLCNTERKIRLRPLQMDLLVFLARSAGRVVAKETLFEKVWKGAAVEDGALPRCISELRGALGDSAQSPVFIETLPRRGYRLLAPVGPLPSAVAEPRAAEAPETGTGSRSQPTTTRTSPRRNQRIVVPMPKKPLSLSFATLLLCSLVLLLGHRHGIEADIRTSSAPTADRAEGTSRTMQDFDDWGATAVLGFHNLSQQREHEWLSTALTEMIASEMALSPRLRPVSGPTFADSRRGLSWVGPEPPSAEQGRALREALGVERVVFGFFLVIDGKDEEQLRVDLWVQSAASGETLVNVAESGPSSDLFELVRFMGARLREVLGVAESASLHRFGAEGSEVGLIAENEAVIERLQESLGRAEEQEDQERIGSIRLHLGSARLIGGDLEAAELAFAGVRAIWEETRDPAWLASALDGLARVAAEKGDPADAVDLVEDAIGLRAESEDRLGLAKSRALLSRLLTDAGDFTAAERMARQALEESEQGNGRSSAAYGALARALLAAGQLDDAERVIERVEKSLGPGALTDFDQVQLAITAARVRVARGDLDRATSTLRGIRQRAERGGAWILAAAASIALGELELRAGQTDAARTRLLSLRADALARGYLSLAEQAFRVAEEGRHSSYAASASYGPESIEPDTVSP